MPLRWRRGGISDECPKAGVAFEQPAEESSVFVARRTDAKFDNRTGFVMGSSSREMTHIKLAFLIAAAFALAFTAQRGNAASSLKKSAA
jgi:hypothetical protein